MEPHVYTSETLGKIKANRPKRREGDGYGGLAIVGQHPGGADSPIRRCANGAACSPPRHLLGVYAPDELERDGPVDVTPITSLANRLRDAKKAHAEGSRGFDAAHVAQAGASVIEGEATSPADKEAGDDGSSNGASMSLDGDGRVDGSSRSGR